ncbi:MAG: DMT family transporter [Rhodospirillales bacterium]|nr:DMT family transporter [Rhodospirillales bacterium]
MPKATEHDLVSTQNAYGLVVLLVLIWGLNWPVMKIGLEDISPIWLTTIRLLLGAACLCTLLAVQGRFTLPRRQDYPIVFTIGVMQIAVALSLISFGLMLVPAGRAALINNTTPLWAIPLAYLFLKERITFAKLIGLLLGLIGTIILFYPGEVDWRKQNELLGNASLIASAIIWAGAIVHLRGHKFTSSPIDLMPWQLLIGGLLLVPVALLIEGLPAPNFTTSLVGVFLYTGPFVSAFSFWLYINVARTLPAASTALTGMGEPVAGLGFSALMLGEAISGAELSGLALIVLGVGATAASDLRR